MPVFCFVLFCLRRRTRHARPFSHIPTLLPPNKNHQRLVTQSTLLTTEECLLNPNRNPGLSKAEIEAVLRRHLGVTKVIWLPKCVQERDDAVFLLGALAAVAECRASSTPPARQKQKQNTKRGLYGDHDTNGHVDNFANFSAPGVVLLAWTDDASDPQHAISVEAEALLREERDAKGRALKVIRLPCPEPMFRMQEEWESLVSRFCLLCVVCVLCMPRVGHTERPSNKNTHA